MDEKNQNLAASLKQLISGDVAIDEQTREHYSHDASLFELRPEVVVFPKNTEDICKLVEYVNTHKADQPHLSLTPRSGGTDMSGGAINESIIMAFERYFTNIGAVENNTVTVQPGVYYRDLEPETLKHGLLLPTYPASREICQIGGMVANNSGGEKSLKYGKTDRYVRQVKVVLRDGKEHTFRPLSRAELDDKLTEQSLEGEVYRQIYELVTTHQDKLAASKPKVSKNSTGYNLWDVWDGETFDITKLIVGSQGTLGSVTEVTFDLVPAKPLSGMLVVFLPGMDHLGDIINEALTQDPTSLESFDDHTLLFAFRFFFSFRKTLGWKRFIILGLSFIPLLGKLVRFLPRLPKIILLCQFEGDNQSEIEEKINNLQAAFNKRGLETHVAKDKHQEEKFWVMRRESFNLLRKNVRRKHTAPFIDDLIVPPETLPEFLPQLAEILDRHKLLYTVAGHMGDGNFHVIPLMELAKKAEREKIYPVLDEVTSLVLKYGGSLSGEHNDGLIRGPMIERMYGPEIASLMREVKHIFDPDNIFNPHKKTDATREFSERNMRASF